MKKSRNREIEDTHFSQNPFLAQFRSSPLDMVKGDELWDWEDTKPFRKTKKASTIVLSVVSVEHFFAATMPLQIRISLIAKPGLLIE